MKTAISFALLLLIGMPVAFVLIGATFAYMIFEDNFRVLGALPSIMFSGLDVFDLLAIPLFILLGEAMNAGGLTQRLIDAARLLLQRLPNALAYVCLTANLMLASIMGSATAQIAVMTSVMVPEMEKDGYSKGFSTALTAAAGMLGPIIPPSMPFIIYGVIAQISVADMFVAGILPGLLLFAILALMITFRGPRREVRPDAEVQPFLTKPRARVLLDALAAMSIPGVIVFGISYGVVTPTESAALALGIALVLGGFFYRELKLHHASEVLSRTALNSALVLFLIATAKVFGWVLAYYQVPQEMAGVLQGLTTDPVIFMLLVFGFAMLVGAVIDGLAALIVLVPILLPIATGVYGIDPVHFGVMLCMTFGIGLLTPPVGTGLYIAAALSGMPLLQLVREIVPFVLVTMVVVMIVAIFPWFTGYLR